MRAQLARVVAGAVDQRGFPAPQELQPHQIQARAIGDAAVVADHALAVEHRQLEPRIVRTVAGRPDDRLDRPAGEVEAERRRVLDPRGRQAMRRLDRRRRRRCRAPTRRSGSSSRPILRSDSAHMLRSEPANCALPSAMPARRPTSVTPMSVRALRSSVERSGVPASCSEGTRRARAMSSTCVIALVVHAGGVHPPLDVPAAIDARRADVLADRQGDWAARALDFVGDLGAARRRAHHQHAAVGELAGIAVLLRGQAWRSTAARARRRRACRRCCRRPTPARRLRHCQSPRSVRTR